MFMCVEPESIMAAVSPCVPFGNDDDDDDDNNVEDGS